MALTVTDRTPATASENSSDLSYGISPATNFNAGPRAIAIFMVEYDNSGTAGADPFSSVADTQGNTWTEIRRELRDPGAANAGCVAAAFYTEQNVATLTTSDTVTLTLSVNTTIKCLLLVEVQAAAGSKPNLLTAVTNSGGYTNATGGSVTTSASLQVDELCFGMYGIEHTAAMTADTDVTNGSWQAAITRTAGSLATGGRVGSQWKTQTTTASTQTFNTLIGGTNHDGAIIVFGFNEVLLDATGTLTTITPTTTFNSPGGAAGGAPTIATPSLTLAQLAFGISEAPDDVVIAFTINVPTVPSGDQTASPTVVTTVISPQQLEGGTSEVVDDIIAAFTNNNPTSSDSGSLSPLTPSVLAQQGLMGASELIDTTTFAVTLNSEEGSTVERLDNAPITANLNQLLSSITESPDDVVVVISSQALAPNISEQLDGNALVVSASQLEASASGSEQSFVLVIADEVLAGASSNELQALLIEILSNVVTGLDEGILVVLVLPQGETSTRVTVGPTEARLLEPTAATSTRVP